MAFLDRMEKIALGVASVGLGALSIAVAVNDDSDDARTVATLLGGAALAVGGVNFADSVTDLVKTPPPQGNAPQIASRV